jgi:hypothetical protein
MNRRTRKILRILFIALFIFFFSGMWEARAMVPLMDGKLQLKGSFDTFMFLRTHIPGEERDFHNSNVGELLNTARLEALYNMVQKGDLTINIQSIFRYYYEAITVLDRQMHDGIPPGMRNNYELPTYYHDDPVNELYVDIMKGPWNIRVGKQIVTWGETSLQRTADVVNPLDIRYSVPGIVPFEDIKLGLYMLRTFYQSELPGHLLFETIFVPTDHQMMRLPYEGTNWGPGLLNLDDPNSMGNGLFTMFQNGWKNDRPSRRSIKDYQWGCRMTGETKGVLWTLLYYDMVDCLPVGNPNRANQQVTAFFTERALLGGGPYDVKLFDDVWQYKRTKYVGGTFQWFESVYTQSIVRGEVAYQIGQHYNTTNYSGRNVWIPPFTYKGIATGGYYSNQKSLVTGIEERDGIGYGLAIDRPTLWPWLMKYNDFRKLDIGIQVFQDWVLKHSRDLSIPSRGRGDRNSTSVTLFLQSSFLKQEVMLTYNGSYNLTGRGYHVWDCLYAPGDHWRYTVGCIFYWNTTSWTQEKGNYDKDCVYFRLKYEW